MRILLWTALMSAACALLCPALRPVSVSSTRRYLTTNIYIVGKKSVSEDWIGHGYDDYQRRLSSSLKIQTVFLKSDAELIKSVKTAKGIVYALDETGVEMTSEEFSKELSKAYERGGSHVDFVIGGHDGLPDQLKASLPLLSLSKMTWPHQTARLLLIEQIYRAFEIKKGSNYHR
jgi:23S rRNA (pseudouridine1915-N3)-methyltransferase